MRKIRIGNDIRLKLKIEPNTLAGFDKIDEFDQSSVKQLKCYFIHIPKRDEIEVHPKPFSRVGFPEFYLPTAHNINNSGHSCYHISPANLCNYDRFEPDFHDFHWWPGYRGFGLHPEHFHDCCPHIQHGPKPLPLFYEFGNRDFPHEFPHWYLADSQVLNEKNTLTCMFPAHEQLFCGVYKLIVVITVYEHGWGRHNLRTYTVDKGEVFELVDNGGESGNIYIGVDSSGERENLIDSITTESKSYTLSTDMDLPIGGFDILDNPYNIYLNLKDGTLAIYNGKNPNIGQLIFTSSDESALTIDSTGTMHSYDYDGQDADRLVTVTVSDIDNNVSCTFVVTIKKVDSIKMGFDLQPNVQAVNINSSNFKEYDIRALNHVLQNPESGRYLYVFSQRRIHYIKSVVDGNDIVAELSSGIRVPMMNAVVRDGYFCYRSVSPILADNEVRIKIKFA